MAGTKLIAERIRLNRQGYTSSGRYYGAGAPLYNVYPKDSPSGEPSLEVRASNATEAKRAWCRKYGAHYHAAECHCNKCKHT